MSSTPRYLSKTRALVFDFGSPQEFYEALPNSPRPGVRGAGGTEEPQEWRGGLRFSEAREALVRGHASVSLPHAELDPLWDTETNALGLAPRGFSPCVPAAIAGDPASMYALEPAMGLGPIRLFVGVNSRQDISRELICKRGVALIQLVRSLALVRPVTLFAYCDHHAVHEKAQAVFETVQLDPLDTNSTLFCLAHAGFLRQLCFEFNAEYGFDGNYGWGARTPSDEDHTKKRRLTLGLTPEDLLIPGGVPDPLLLENPVEWFNQEVKKQGPDNQSACNS